MNSGNFQIQSLWITRQLIICGVLCFVTLWIWTRTLLIHRDTTPDVKPGQNRFWFFSSSWRTRGLSLLLCSRPQSHLETGEIDHTWLSLQQLVQVELVQVELVMLVNMLLTDLQSLLPDSNSVRGFHFKMHQNKNKDKWANVWNVLQLQMLPDASSCFQMFPAEQNKDVCLVWCCILMFVELLLDPTARCWAVVSRQTRFGPWWQRSPRTLGVNRPAVIKLLHADPAQHSLYVQVLQGSDA